MVRIYQVEMQLMPQLTSAGFLVFQPVSDAIRLFSKGTQSQALLLLLTSRHVFLNFRMGSINFLIS